MLTEGFLLESWRYMNKKSACGVDNVTAKDYAVNLWSNIKDLVKRVRDKRYRARFVKRTYIPKAKGKQRPLGLPTIVDKLLQTAVARILMAIFEVDFLPHSFAYRPKIGALHAVKFTTRKLQFGRITYIIDADVKGFFDNINHKWMVRMLRERIDDEPFIRLICKWLKAGILETDGKVINPITGTPQGGVISPVLANIYLHYVLDLWFEKVVKPRCDGDAFICRYADDFICAFQLARDATKFYQVLGKRLLKFGLELSKEKTRLIKFSRFHKYKTRFDFLGFEFSWGTDRKGKPHVMRYTSRDKLKNSLLNFKLWCKKSRNFRLKKLFSILNKKLLGYYNYYGLIGNYERLREFYFNAMGILYKWLNRRSQRKSFNLDEFKAALKRYSILKPRITEQRNLQLNLLPL